MQKKGMSLTFWIKKKMETSNSNKKKKNMTDMDKDVQNLPLISNEYCLDAKEKKYYVKVYTAAILKRYTELIYKITWPSYLFSNINDNYYQLGSKNIII